ncbi:MAG: hypothetical protein LUH15_19940 [Tannerellaceae bacterium]|nr:hypothetical protein [Tannerellaceae bacterium]
MEKDFLTKGLERIEIAKKYEWIVILPGSGCQGCIQEGEYFLKENIENEKILFILTKTASLKILQQKTGISLREQENVYIDSNYIFDIPSENKIYPCVIKLQDGKLIEYEFQSPNNAAFLKLKKRLTV